MKKKHILVGHPYWGRGGAEIAAMWMLQTLLKEYRVDVVTRGGWDLDELNRAAGTNIQKDAVQVRYAPLANFRFAGALWLGCFKRFCRKIAQQYDLCITASRVIDWGVPAIHFLSDVTWNQDLQKHFNNAENQARKGLLRRVYWRLGDIIAGKSGREPNRHDCFIANSQWTAKYAAEYCGEPLKVIYPPVPGTFLNLEPWDNRENSFICLGRISVEKNIEQVISILEMVRETHPTITLHLVGLFDESLYSSKILTLCESRENWIVIYNGLFGEEKEILLGSCRYGISACTQEAFGISTAEMMKSGIIAFAPKEGAQHELLKDYRLLYSSTDDAVEKICTIIGSRITRKELSVKMIRTGDFFSTEKFCLEVLRFTKAVMKSKKRPELNCR